MHTITSPCHAVLTEINEKILPEFERLTSLYGKTLADPRNVLGTNPLCHWHISGAVHYLKYDDMLPPAVAMRRTISALDECERKLIRHTDAYSQQAVNLLITAKSMVQTALQKQIHTTVHTYIHY